MRPSISVLSFNIHKGFGYRRRHFTLYDIRDQIQKLGSTIVFLQEVVGENGRHRKNLENWPDASQFEFLADVIWPHYAYGKNAIYTQGHHGNAILSRYPFRSWENIDVSTNRFERRGILHGVVEVPGSDRELHLICLHFDLFASGRRKQVDRLISRVRSHVPSQAPLIVAGDFNDWPQRISRQLELELEVVEVFEELTGRHAASFPSWFPLICLDRIYVRGLRIDTVEVLKDSPWTKLSDHIPIMATLKIE